MSEYQDYLFEECQDLRREVDTLKIALKLANKRAKHVLRYLERALRVSETEQEDKMEAIEDLAIAQEGGDDG